MQLSDFNYDLPEELIAYAPLEQRSKSRLMCLNRSTQKVTHSLFYKLQSYLKPGDLLVLNDTRVIKARLYGRKSTGGKVEILVERILNDSQALVHIKASKSVSIGTLIHIIDDCYMQVLEKQHGLYRVRSSENIVFSDILDLFGTIPLPPYIRRDAQEMDLSRYQTVYSMHKGSVAAPTAGLHFDVNLLNALQHKGVNIAYVTLHVGAGTFQPVRSENIFEHEMHSECVNVTENVCRQIKHTKQNGGRVIAVGTTSVRALETAARDGEISPFTSETKLFITPGYRFKIVDALITNFHLPKSSLLMLVAAFAGLEFMHQSYQSAIHEQYRFYSYGDAMFIQ